MTEGNRVEPYMAWELDLQPIQINLLEEKAKSKSKDCLTGTGWGD